LRAKQISQEQHVTLRELVAAGLAYVIEQRSTAATRHITPVTFRGKGLSAEFSRASWAAIRDTAYEEHGA
jgi:hypothetical protein